MDSSKITIIGAGNQGFALTAYLCMNNIQCYLYNRSRKNIESVIESKKIICSGIWNKTVSVADASTEIKSVLQKFIIVTTPAYAHKEIASLLAEYVDDSYVIILSPEKVLGIVDFISSLKEFGCKKLPLVAGCQTTICASRKNGTSRVNVCGIKDNILIASTQREYLNVIMQRMPECLRRFYKIADSYIETSLGNVGMVLHPIPMLLNFGAIERGAVFRYYMEGITPAIADMIENLDSERLVIGRNLGYELEPIVAWMQRNYQVTGTSLYECLQQNCCYQNILAPNSINNRFIQEDIPYGLVPMETLAKSLGIETPVTTEIVTFASLLMKVDYRKCGRTYLAHDL